MTEQIFIQTGYSRIERKITVPFGKSASYLLSKRRRSITRAEETQFGIEVTRHAFRCPHCGKEIPAYGNSDGSLLPEAEDVKKWCDLQLDMFHTEAKAPLLFRTPLEKQQLFRCPRCKSTSLYDETRIPLLLEWDKKAIRLSRPVQGLEDLLSIPWFRHVSLEGNESLREVMIFDLQSGSIRLALENEDGVSPVSRFLIQPLAEEELGFFAPLLSKNRVVKRKLKAAFQSFWTRPIPFNLEELEFKTFLCLTFFTDFPREFFDAVPWEHGKNTIMEDFYFPASFLRTPKNAAKMLGETGLPPKKSVKRIFAEKPGLFFYLPECKELWKLLGDLNTFCAFLRMDHVFHVLSSLHQYPGALDFYKDFKEILGAKALLKILRKNFIPVQNRAIGYAALSDSVKEQVKETLAKGDDFCDLSYARAQNVVFSYPLLPIPEHFREISVDSFRFQWLRSTADCHRAGVALNNCLVSWHGMRNPVAVVLQGREYVATVEIENNSVLQFLGKENKPVDENTPLNKAFVKWARHFDLDTENINEDDLPF